MTRREALENMDDFHMQATRFKVRFMEGEFIDKIDYHQHFIIQNDVSMISRDITQILGRIGYIDLGDEPQVYPTSKEVFDAFNKSQLMLLRLEDELKNGSMEGFIDDEAKDLIYEEIESLIKSVTFLLPELKQNK